MATTSELVARPTRSSALSLATRAARRVTSLGATVGDLLLRDAQPPAGGSPAARVRASAAVLQRTMQDLCETHGVFVDAVGLSRLPLGPAVFVANHLGYLDPIIIGAHVRVSPIAKAEIADWPVVGARAAALGVNFVRRGNPHSGAVALRRAARALGAGVSVLNFPEGTTTRGETVLPFSRGIFGVARLLGVPVVPLRLDFRDRDVAWVGDATFLPHYLRTASRSVVRARLAVGHPIPATAERDASTLARLARFVIQSELAPS